jgi:hypothetical protein
MEPTLRGRSGRWDESFDTMNLMADLMDGKGWDRPISNLSDTQSILSICREMRNGLTAIGRLSESFDPSSFSPTEPRTGVGLVLDGVRTATTIAPVLVPMGATGDNHAYLDLWSWISHHAPSDGKNQMFPDAEKVQNHPFGISKSGEIMFPSMTSASTFLHARMTLADLSGESGTADPEPEVKGAFIPAWKDKRGVKVIDHTGGRFPVFHDEVRCSVCNGRVLVKMPDGNKTGEWDCPQCDEKGAVKFKHLISPQHSGSDAPKESEK